MFYYRGWPMPIRCSIAYAFAVPRAVPVESVALDKCSVHLVWSICNYKRLRLHMVVPMFVDSELKNGNQTCIHAVKKLRRFRFMQHLHCSIAVVETCPINFIMRYGVAKISPKNVMIGQADTFFGWPSAVGGVNATPPPEAAEKISSSRSIDGSTFRKPNMYNNLQEIAQNEMPSSPTQSTVWTMQMCGATYFL